MQPPLDSGGSVTLICSPRLTLITLSLALQPTLGNRGMAGSLTSHAGVRLFAAALLLGGVAHLQAEDGGNRLKEWMSLSRALRPCVHN